MKNEKILKNIEKYENILHEENHSIRVGVRAFTENFSVLIKRKIVSKQINNYLV